MSAKHRACSLCESEASWVCRQRLLGKYDVDYFLCSTCDLLQTEQPYWLDEAYTQAISQLDTGAVQRNETASELTTVMAAVLAVDAAAPCLDYGGGHGVFVRMMRDRGLDFRWFDKYAENLFARGFEGALGEPYAIVTAFEVLEHLASVREELDRLFAAQHDVVLVGTVLHHGHHPGWWYYMLESGQHVTFYARRTLEWIGERFGYDVFVGAEYSVFTRRGAAVGSVRRALLRQLTRRPTATVSLVRLVPRPLLRRISPYRSRVDDDHQLMRARTRP